MITPMGAGWHLARWHAYVCMSAACVLYYACWQVGFSCLFVLARLSVLAWRAWPQAAWAASEGPACPQSLTICALLVVIKVSNLEVSWGLAKRGQKMSLRCSSWWAAATVFTYLYTLIVFALLLWHWGNCSLEREKVHRAHEHSHKNVASLLI